MKRWPLHTTYFWERAPFFRILLPLAAGIAGYEYGWLSLNVLPIFILLLIVLAGYVVTALIKNRNNAVSFIDSCLLCSVLFLVGWLLCYQHDVRNNKQWFGKSIGDSEAFTARIKNDPAEKDRTWKLEVDMLNSMSNSIVKEVKGKAFVYLYKDGLPLTYKKGDTILLQNKFTPIKNAGNPFEFDYARYCARNNIYYQAFLPIEETAIYCHGSEEELKWTERAHTLCAAQLQHYVKDTITLGLLQAILIGENVNLDNELRQAYSDTGIVHIIAISGSHISFFFFVIAVLFSWIKNRKYKWLQYFIALPLIWFYVLMAGAPPSAVRAAMMFSILGIGFSLQKSANSLNYLLAAAVLLLCAEPMWLFSAGFQLSFVAVLSLILFYRPVYQLVSPVNKITRLLWGAIAASLAAEILIAPLVVYYFHLFPVSFIVANLAAYFFMGVVMIAGMLIILLSFIPVVASSLAAWTVFIVGYFNQLVGSLQQLNPKSFTYLVLNGAEVIILYLAIAGIAVFLMNKKKAGVYVGLGAFCVLLVLLCRNEWVALKQERLVVYNINRVSHAELIKGKRYHVLNTDSVNPRSKYYSIQPAHTAWKAYREAAKTDNKELIAVAGQTVLFLNDPPRNQQELPVDYLIINYPYKEVVAGQLNELFSPKKMVISGNYSRKRTAEWKEACRQLGVTLHATSTDGAFILESL